MNLLAIAVVGWTGMILAVPDRVADDDAGEAAAVAVAMIDAALVAHLVPEKFDEEEYHQMTAAPASRFGRLGLAYEEL